MSRASPSRNGGSTPLTPDAAAAAAAQAPALRKRNPSPDVPDQAAAAAASSADQPDAKESSALSSYKAQLKRERKRVTLLRAPFQTLTVFAQVVAGWVWQGLRFLLSHRLLSYGLTLATLASLAFVVLAGPSSPYVLQARASAWFVVWWLTLGVLSSVGLGTGLHTFVLYLGPYIAMVTLAVTECDTINVPLDGPNAMQCPPPGTPKEAVTFLRLLLKVLPACFLWGAGTAIGELPPYFVSRQARLSGQKLDELDELEEEDRGERAPSRLDRVKLVLFHALQRWGFWAIVVCASVPNPLFDLAGLTCGHFLIPFWTFFGATFIGKALIKVQIQSAFVVLAFDKNRLAWIISRVERMLPAIEGKLAPIFEKQRQQFHADAQQQATTEGGGSWIAFVWNWLLIVMLLFFVKSIIESSVQERLVERDAERIEEYARTHATRVGVTTRLMEKRAQENKHSK